MMLGLLVVITLFGLTVAVLQVLEGDIGFAIANAGILSVVWASYLIRRRLKASHKPDRNETTSGQEGGSP